MGGAGRQVASLMRLALLQPLVWCVVVAQSSSQLMQDEPEPQVEYSCEDIGSVPKEQQCSFVRTECEAESRVPYTQWYYCNVAPYGILAKALFVVVLLVLLPLLFTALGDTAELYFSPTMAIVAQTIPGMRPRFAGVTFVAMGNGAPDLSANISALRTGQVALSAGAFTGAAMFVQCVVASEVIRISGGVRCRGATLRDVGVYAVCVTGVGLALHSGKVTRWFVAGAALAYLAYVIWVFAGDEWHARGRPELRPGLGMSWGELRAVLLERQYRRKHKEELMAGNPHSPPPTYPPPPVPTAGGGEEGLTEALLPWASIDEPLSTATTTFPNHHKHDVSSNNLPAAPFWAAGEGDAAADGSARGGTGAWPQLHPSAPSALGLAALPTAPAGDGAGLTWGHVTPRTPSPFTSPAQGAWDDSLQHAPAQGAWDESQQQLHNGEGPATGSVARRTPTSVTFPPQQGAWAHPQPHDGLDRVREWSMMAKPASHSDLQGLMQGATSPSPRGSPTPALAPVAARAEGGHATGTGTLRSRASGGNSARGPGSGVLGARMYRQAVWADLAYEPTSRGRRHLAVELRGAGPGATAARTLSTSLSTQPPTTHTHPSTSTLQPEAYLTPWDVEPGGPGSGLAARGRAPSGGRLGSGGDRGEGVGVLLDALQQSAPSTPVASHGGGRAPSGALPPELWSKAWWKQLWAGVCEELTFGSSQEWPSLPAWRRRIRTTSFSLLLPLYTALRLSVPMADPETYNQQWLVASMLCSPMMMVAYFGWFSVGAVACAMVAGALVAGVVHLLTRDEMELPALDCGTTFSFGPAVVSLVGFFMGVLWIDSLASEVVGVISLLSGLLRLPPSLVGLTLLAWGNSLGDFFGNVAMAKRGASSTALTACFAAPLFNMLMSMALGFSAYFAKEGVTSAHVTLPLDAALGCVALVTYNAILAGVGLANNYCIPARFYLFARAWYCLYLAAAAVLAITAA